VLSEIGEGTMSKKAFPFRLADRVNVPGKRGVQGFVSLPMNASDGTVAERVRCVAKGGEEDEGRIVFVCWIAEDGTRARAYFTEAALILANPAVV
jgi:hypothetical protein